MRRELRVDMTLTSSLWTKFNQIIVTLAERDKSRQLEQLASIAEMLWIEADALHQKIHPLL
jgi:hypothetical protein